MGKKKQKISYKKVDPSNLLNFTIPSSHASTLVVENERNATLNCAMAKGLDNLGNTCYFNSVLQCLARTPWLAEELLNCSIDALSEELTKTLFELREGGPSLSPSVLINLFRNRNPAFKINQQEDAHEFLISLLNCTLLKKDLFKGSVVSKITCGECLSVSKTYETFYDLPLPLETCCLEEDLTLQTCFSNFTKLERLEGINEVVCGICTQKQDDGNNVYTKKTKQYKIVETPSVLILQLVRFRLDSSIGKISSRISIPLKFEISSFCETASCTDRPTYLLYGVIEHIGDAHSGHYVAYVIVENGIWYRISDSQIVQVSESTVLSCQPYILFYKEE